MTGEQARAAIKLLLSAYPTQRQRMTANDAIGMTQAYAGAFVNLDEAHVRAAIAALILTEKWLPSIAQIVGKVSEMRGGRRREGGDAWGDVLAAMRRWGWARAPGIDFQFADPIVARVVAAFGWGDLCGSENTVADRARFIELYAQIASTEAVDRAVAGALPGSTAKELPKGTIPIGEATQRILEAAKNGHRP